MCEGKELIISEANLKKKKKYWRIMNDENQAVLFALNKAKEFQLCQILFLTNFYKVFGVIKGNEDWVIKSFLINIVNFIKCFAFIEFKHFFRVLNVAVHSMAKSCISLVWSSTFLTVLNDSFVDVFI